MKKLILLFLIIEGVVFTVTYHSLAQVNNAGLPNQNPTPPAAAKGDKNKSDQIIEKLPAWMIELPLAKSKTEKKYDVNRDGRLQKYETKIYLRDVLDTVDEKGGYTLDSDVLKEYDKNKDGFISRLEAIEIKNQVRK